jgi:hypothetical protein
MAGAAGGGGLELGWVPSGGCADEEEDAEGCMAAGGGGGRSGAGVFCLVAGEWRWRFGIWGRRRNSRVGTTLKRRGRERVSFAQKARREIFLVVGSSFTLGSVRFDSPRRTSDLRAGSDAFQINYRVSFRLSRRVA